MIAGNRSAELGWLLWRLGMPGATVDTITGPPSGNPVTRSGQGGGGAQQRVGGNAHGEGQRPIGYGPPGHTGAGIHPYEAAPRQGTGPGRSGVRGQPQHQGPNTGGQAQRGNARGIRVQAFARTRRPHTKEPAQAMVLLGAAALSGAKYGRPGATRKRSGEYRCRRSPERGSARPRWRCGAATSGAKYARPRAAEQCSGKSGSRQPAEPGPCSPGNWPGPKWRRGAAALSGANYDRPESTRQPCGEYRCRPSPERGGCWPGQHTSGRHD